MRDFRWLNILVMGTLLATVSAGCEFSQRSTSFGPSTVAAPTPAGSAMPSLVGHWTSRPPATLAAVTIPQLRGCSDFQWNVTTESADGADGAFSLACADSISLSGTASGLLLSATSLQLSVTGWATLPGVGSCPFSLAGTGTLSADGNSLHIPFTGTTCLGPVSGEETLYRDELFPPPPPPPAPPPPPPVPDPDPVPGPGPGPTVPCASSDGKAIVNCIEATFAEYRRAGVSFDERVANMAFLRDRVIEAGICGGLDLAWNKKRGTGPHSIDALAWRHSNGVVDVVDIGTAYDDTSRELDLMWLIVGGPAGYDPYPHPGCN